MTTRGLGGLLMALGVAGCAGSPLGDSIAGPEKLAARDDAYCQSIGAAHGTPQYMNCRMVVTQQREDKFNTFRSSAMAQPGPVFVTPGTAQRY